MGDEKKRKMLQRIEELMSYGEPTPTIEPSLLKYLDEAALRGILETLERRREKLIEDEKEWLAQFRKEES
ncbi:hypothetical protein [Nitratifractor sp.]|uniref:hypothetical protein n=1 Tax=Nitratifractor sp. TaxID=2268144 RepID=UPI0025EBC43E|nr:hypothetical protein [Nitratifractor sp.]